jgi:hypothetical protein
MLNKLTFKKAFGIRTIPPECMGWIFDFTRFQALTFTIGTTDFTFRMGRFGESKQEKIILSYGLPSHDRDLDTIHPTITLDISLYVDVTIDETYHDGGILNYSKFDGIIEPFIPLALEALNRAIDAHRIAKYMIK